MKETLDLDIQAEKEHVKALEVQLQTVTEELQFERRDHLEKREQLSRYEDQLQSIQEQYNKLRNESSHMQHGLGNEQRFQGMNLVSMEIVCVYYDGSLICNCIIDIYFTFLKGVKLRR